jgi:hypothetical protein
VIEIFFSILFLLVSYFMTTLALVQGYIPGTSKIVQEKDGKVRQVLQYGKILLISFVIASIFSGLMFYYFVYPLYYPL